MRSLIPLLLLPIALAGALPAPACAQVEVRAAESSVQVDEQEDILGLALERLGLERDDLGYRPRSSWTRFPLPEGIPHLSHVFEDLFERPLVTPRFIHGLADPVRRYLDPANLAENDDALYQLTYFLAVEKFAQGFRNYSANAVVELDPETPLLEAFARLRREFGEGSRAHSFGSRYDTPESHPDRELRASVEALDPALRPILAELILGLAESARWSRLSFRRADRELLESVLSLADLRESETYYPQVDDLADLWDRQSLCYGALKAAQHLDRARLALLELPESARSGEGILLEHDTPLGRVVLSGVDKGEYRSEDCLLWLDLGGDDRYDGPLAGSRGPALPVSTLLDLAGDDRYRAEDGALGAGLLGVGMLLDVAGDDDYESLTRGQGYGQFGIGLLADLEGEDAWRHESGGQGAGYFGCGLHLDGTGDDSYYLLGEGQGFGGVGGVGVLASWGGDDEYTAEPYAEVAGRADYHSDHEIAANAAQGAGMGRRGDGSDGHSWAGGLGAILDIHGKDHYRSGNWSLGCGYWFGIGLMYEGEGDDSYESVYFTQASGAHFCIGAILDEGGDDEHVLFGNAGAALAFGWDYTNALLIDTEGDDLYQAKIISLGLAEIRSNAILLDLAGDDTYRLDAGQLGLGASDSRDYYGKAPATAPYYGESLSIGLLLDAGGRDRYERRDAEKDRFSPDSLLADTLWRILPAADDEGAGEGNHGAFWDREFGRLPELEPYLESR